MGKKTTTQNHPLPSKEEILNFIQTSQGKVGKREIAKAFHIKGGERIVLKRLLKEMADEGMIEGNRKAMRQPGVLSNVSIIKILGQDEHGDFYGKPYRWDEANEGPAPIVMIGEGKSTRSTPPGIGDRVLSNIDKISFEETGYNYMARPIKVLPKDTQRLLGIYQRNDMGGEIQPIDKKQLKSWFVSNDDNGEAMPGELVAFEIISRGRFSTARARVVERLGNPQDQGLISLIAIETHGIPHHFSERVLAELDSLPELTLADRDDMRDIPFITIDPSDARDHDDAVWATTDDSEDNEGGYIVIVAIADVSFYVQPGSALDREALNRGNSVYFPDRVVPMLPELISNDLCSLREGEERPALAVRLVFDKNGRKQAHSFQRILMKSAAKLSYDQAQAAIDGRVDDKTAPLLEPILKPLWAAYEAVKMERNERAPLDLDLPERKIIMDDAGEIKDIITPDRFDAHKLIEEFMIQANVAAAETLERKNSPLIYRVHDTPSDEKVMAFKDFLSTLDMGFGGSGPLKASNFNGILSKVRGKEWEAMVTEVVLRSQSQAEYSPINYGHFGLNLSRYAHFTSPIRRYADLIVHRALVRALGFGAGGLSDDEVEELETVAQQISDYERRAMLAERETIDRLVASFLSSKEGAEFKGRVSGVTRVGLFVKLDDTGADGFIPISTIGGDYYIHNEEAQTLVGERTGATYHLGQRVDVRLIEIVPTAGAIRFEMLSDGVEAEEGAPLPKRNAGRNSGRNGGRGGRGGASARATKPHGKSRHSFKAKSQRKSASKSEADDKKAAQREDGGRSARRDGHRDDKPRSERGQSERDGQKPRGKIYKTKRVANLGDEERSRGSEGRSYKDSKSEGKSTGAKGGRRVSNEENKTRGVSRKIARKSGGRDQFKDGGGKKR